MSNVSDAVAKYRESRGLDVKPQQAPSETGGSGSAGADLSGSIAAYRASRGLEPAQPSKQEAWFTPTVYQNHNQSELNHLTRKATSDPNPHARKAATLELVQKGYITGGQSSVIQNDNDQKYRMQAAYAGSSQGKQNIAYDSWQKAKDNTDAARQALKAAKMSAIGDKTASNRAGEKTPEESVLKFREAQAAFEAAKTAEAEAKKRWKEAGGKVDIGKTIWNSAVAGASGIANAGYSLLDALTVDGGFGDEIATILGIGWNDTIGQIDGIGPLEVGNGAISRANQANKLYGEAKREEAYKAAGASRAAQNAAKYNEMIVQAVPYSVAAILSGGVSAAPELAAAAGAQSAPVIERIARATLGMMKDPNWKLSFIMSLGPSYEDAKADGASDEGAALFAILNGWNNATIEVGGLADGAGGLQALPEDVRGIVGDGSRSKLLQYVKSLGKSTLGEIGEELQQGAMENALRPAYGKNVPLYSLTDEQAIINPNRMAEEAKGAAVVSGVLGAGQTVAQNAYTNLIQKATANTQTINNQDSAPDNTPQVNQTTAEGVIPAPVQEDEQGSTQIPPPTQNASTGQNGELNSQGTPALQTDTENDILKGQATDNLSGFSDKQIRVFETKPAIKTTAKDWAKVKDARIDYYRGVPEAQIPMIDAFVIAEYNKLNTAYRYIVRNSGRDAFEIIGKYKVKNSYANLEGEKNGGTTDAGNSENAFSKDPGSERGTLGSDNRRTGYGGADAGVQGVAGGLSESGVSELPYEITGNSGNTVNPSQQTEDGGNETKGGLVHTQDRVFETNLSEEEANMPGLTEEEARHEQHKDKVVTAEAQARITADRKGERDRLVASREWDDIDTAAAGLLIREEIENARKLAATGDTEGATKAYERLAELKKAWNENGTKEGQALRQRKNFVAEAAVAEAAKILYGEHRANEKQTRKLRPQKKAEIMESVTNCAEQFNKLQEGDTASLIDLIKQIARIRRTTALFSKDTGSTLNRTLEAVASKEGGEQFLRDVCTTQIKSIASDYVSPGAINSLNAWRFMAMLSNPKTTLTNLSSNFLLGSVLETLANNAAVFPDMLLSGISGKRTVGFEGGVFQKAYWKGLTEAVQKSFIEVALDANTEDMGKGYLEGKGNTFKLTGSPIERVLSRAQQYFNLALKTTDEAARGATRATTTSALTKLVDKDKADTADVQELAANDADYRALLQESKAADMAIGLRGVLDKIGIGNERTGRYGLGKDVMPFAFVPANSVTAVVDANPFMAGAEALFGVGKLIAKKQNGTLTAADQAKVSKAFGRTVTGAGWVATAMALAAKGIIQDYGDDDKDYAAMLAAENKSGTQLNISALGRLVAGGNTDERADDTWVAVGWMPVLNGLMTLGEDLYDAYAEDNKLSFGDISTASWDSVISAFMDFPAVSKISKLINSFKYSEQEGWGKALDVLETGAAETMTSMLVPNALRATTTGADEYQRDSSGDSLLESSWNYLKSGIPGLRQTLPEKLDSFGKPMKTEDVGRQLANKVFLPGALQRHEQTDVEKLLETIAEETGVKSFIPDRNAPDSFEAEQDTIALRQEDKRTYKATLGTTYENLANRLIKNSIFDALPRDQQIEVLDRVSSYSRYVAKKAVASRQLKVYSDSDWEDISQMTDPSEYLVGNQVISGISNSAKATEDGYKAADRLLNDFQSLNADTQEKLLGKNGVKNMYYSLIQLGMGTKDYKQTTDSIKQVQNSELSGSDGGVSDAAVISKLYSDKTDEEKLNLLKSQNLPNSQTGKYTAVILRTEAALNNGISFDKWVELETLVDANKTGSNPSKAVIQDAASTVFGPGRKELIYSLYKKYTGLSEEEMYDDFYSKDYEAKDKPNLYNYIIATAQK